MTREQFKALPVERVAEIAWSLAYEHGELGRVLEPAPVSRLTDADRERWDYGLNRRLPLSSRFSLLSAAGARTLLDELIRLHPAALEVRACLQARLESLRVSVIDAVMTDLDALDALGVEAA